MSERLEKFTLILQVVIDPAGETSTAMADRIRDVARHAVNNGTLTGDSPSTVEYYEFQVIHHSRQVPTYIGNNKPTHESTQTSDAVSARPAKRRRSRSKS